MSVPLDVVRIQPGVDKDIAEEKVRDTEVDIVVVRGAVRVTGPHPGGAGPALQAALDPAPGEGPALQAVLGPTQGVAITARRRPIPSSARTSAVFLNPHKFRCLGTLHQFTCQEKLSWWQKMASFSNN